MDPTARTIIVRTIDRWEGGINDDPLDAGGLTKFGISRNTFGDVDIENLTKEQAVWIAYAAFYRPLNLSQIDSLRIRWKVFDIAFNTGGWRGAKMLQAAVGTSPDGIIGPVTLHAVNAKVEDTILLELVAGQARHYARILSINPLQRLYAAGWMRRAVDTAGDL